jgi:hypothetical protein
MNVDFEIFEGKSFQSLCEDIYTNQERMKKQIEKLISDLRSMVKGINDAQIVIPFIKDYLGIGVLNNEHLIKLAQVIQRLITAQTSTDDSNVLLSDEEKTKLLDNARKQAETELSEILVSVKDVNR